MEKGKDFAYISIFCFCFYFLFVLKINKNISIHNTNQRTRQKSRMLSSKRYEYYIKNDLDSIKQAILLEYISSIHTDHKKTKFECSRYCDLSYMEYIANELSAIFVDSTITIHEQTEETIHNKTKIKLCVDWSIGAK